MRTYLFILSCADPHLVKIAAASCDAEGEQSA